MSAALPVAREAGDALVRIDSLSTDELAVHANAEARRAEGSALLHMARAGAFLRAAKERVGHGGWLDWLAAHWHGSQQHANRLVHLVEACRGEPERVEQLEAKSLRGALALLGKPVDGGGAAQRPRPNHSRVSNPEPPAGPVDAEFTICPDPAAVPPRPAALAGAVTDPGAMGSLLFGGKAEPETPTTPVRDAAGRARWERMLEDDPIVCCAKALADIKALLVKAKGDYRAMEFHPLDAARLHDRELAHPRDVEFQRLTEFFDVEVPAALEAATKAAALDIESVTHLRDQRDKQAKRKAVRS